MSRPHQKIGRSDGFPSRKDVKRTQFRALDALIEQAEKSTQSKPDFRHDPNGIDYAHFPANAAYVSSGDVRAAYNQGVHDATVALEAVHEVLLQRQSERLADKYDASTVHIPFKDTDD